MMIPNPRRNELISRIMGDAPRAPGVYCLLGRDEEIIYIGKSIDLRRRLLDHMRPARGPREQRRARMSFEIASFVTIPTDSELLALLVEDGLIKRHLPRHNRRQRDFTNYSWLVLSSDDYPFLELRQPLRGAPTGEAFGPFRDHYRADALKRLISDSFGLRLCVTPAPTDRCAAWELGGCQGPCRGETDRARYAEAVTHVREFLSGDATRITIILNEAMRRHASRNEFEQAQEVKEQLTFCKRFCARQRFVLDFAARTLTISEGSEHPQRYLFERGRLLRPELPESAGRDLSSGGPGEDRRFVFDRAHLVWDWLLRQDAACEAVFTD